MKKNKEQPVFKSGDYVWFNGEGWIFLGMDEDGAYLLYRPVKGHPFHIIETALVWLDDKEDYNNFLKENGYSHLIDKELLQ